MKSFKIKQGDLDLSMGRRAAMVNGREKLIQDLSLWLREPMGQGFTTPRFGSLIPAYIGTINPQYLERDIELEVKRVLGLYQVNQHDRLKQSQRNGTLERWSRAEILAQIKEVKVKSYLDRVQISITIRTLSEGDNLVTFLHEVTGG